MNKSEDPKEPIRYGITPLVLFELGWLICLAAVMLVLGLDRLIEWLLQ
jgi:hypothetical protein